MALTDSGLKALLPKEKKDRVSVGDALHVLVYPNGGKYFVWKYRFPPNRSGQFRDYQIGPYGKSPGKWTLKQAKDEVIRLDQLRKAGEHPRLLKSESTRELIKQATNPVFPYKTIAAPCQPTLAFLHRLVRRWPQVREKGCAPYCSAAGSALADS